MHSDHYLTRAQIAEILNISPDHAGRIMKQMPVFIFGKKKRRVSLKDFEDWCFARRVDPTREGEVKKPSPKPVRVRFPRTGSLIEAAKAGLRNSERD